MSMAGLSDGFVYAPKPPAAPAANIRVSVPPYNKDSYSSPNETVMFNIPSGKRGQYLNTRMSYLKFDLEVETDLTRGGNHKPVIALDGGAHALFDSLEVYHGSNLLEQVREYNALYQLMLDMGEIPSSAMAGRSVAEGTIAHGGYTLEPFGTQSHCDSRHRNGTIVSPVMLSDSVQGSRPRKMYETDASGTADPRVTHYTGSGLDYDYVKKAGTGTAATDAKVQAGTTALAGHGVEFSLNSSTDALLHASQWIERPQDRVFTKLDATGGEVDLNLGVSGVTVLFNRDNDIPRTTVYVPKGKSRKSSQTFTFCIPLMSGVLGMQMGKYLPVGALAQDLRLELGISNFTQAFKTVAALITTINTSANADQSPFSDGRVSVFPGDILKSATNFGDIYDFTLKNFDLQLEYIEVSSDVQTAVEAATGGQYVVSFDTFSNVQGSLPLGNTNTTHLIGAKFSSIKTLMTCFRDANMINNPAFPSLTSRVNPFSTKINRPGIDLPGINTHVETAYKNGAGWQYQIGATQYPPKPVSSDQEAYMEAVKSQHSVATKQRDGLIDFTSWTTSARRDGTGPANRWYNYCKPGGTFVLAQNLESQSHKSHLAESGINTLAQSVYLLAKFPMGGNISQAFKVYNTEDGKEDLPTDGAYDTLTHETDDDALPPDHGKVAFYQTNQALQMDHFVHYDGILIISNGRCSTRF